ncbi:MAG: ribosome maturation factor RimM [Candidatus Woesearchaeota archaeon]
MLKKSIPALKILSPKGLNGEMKANILLDDKDFLSSGDILYLSGLEKSLTIKNITYNNNCIVSFEEVPNIDTAKKYSNSTLYIKVKDLEKVQNNEFYLFQILGFDVYVNETSIGKVSSIENYGAQDILVIDSKQTSYLVPIVDDIIEDINQEKSNIKLNQKKFSEVALENEN